MRLDERLEGRRFRVRARAATAFVMVAAAVFGIILTHSEDGAGLVLLNVAGYAFMSLIFLVSAFPMGARKDRARTLPLASGFQYFVGISALSAVGMYFSSRSFSAYRVGAWQEAGMFSFAAGVQLAFLTLGMLYRHFLLSGSPSGDTANAQGDIVEQLTKLAELKDEGLLTVAEFDQAKTKLLSEP